MKEYALAAKKCEKQLWEMCKDRSQDHRDCVLPRCCGICHEATYCPGICDYLKKNIGAGRKGV